jgi:murein DD-endopeptidase MepM/ murein hydrolase activator NlpD
MLIYGHVAESVVVPGQHVIRGQLLGYSGGQNGTLVHLEYRVPDPSTPSGWRIVDPG